MKTVDDLREALDYPFDAPAPDPAAIIAGGRRRRAARRALVGSGVAGAVAVAVLANGAPSRHDGRPDLTDGAPNPVLVAATAPLTRTAPDRFDPLTRTLNIGWIPAGLIDQQAEITPWSQTYSGFDASHVNGGPDVGLVVEVLAKGRPVSDLSDGALGLPLLAVSHPTEPVNGQPAECLSAPEAPRSCPAIRWQYAPGSWARVSYAGSVGTAPETADAVARRVAESVSLTAGEPVRLPFTLTGAPAAMKAARTRVDIYQSGSTGINGERWSASIDLVTSDSDLQNSGDPSRLSIETMQRPDDPSGRIGRDNAPNTTAAGHPAWRQNDGGALVVWGINGTRTVVEYRNHPGDAETMFADVHVLPTPDDPAHWVAVQ